MSETFEWLPDLITLKEYDGDWPTYCEAIYAIFSRDFVASKPAYAGKRFALKRHPEYDGKAATFWHLISTGKDEEERIPQMRRCERIAWPKPIIEAIGNDKVCLWKNTRGRNERILIAVEDFVLLWTAYYVEYPNKRRRMKQEYENWREENEP